MHSQSTNGSDTSELIKIATFNLFNFIEPPGAFYEFENIYTQEQWQKKLDWIATYIDEHQPDVIGFQEVFTPDALAQLTKRCGLEYFAVLDAPEVVDDFIYSKPVVALASRYPITEVHNVTVGDDWASMMGLQDDFAFSRKPLRATISLPKLGPCDCYVVHFKSKRPLFDAQELNGQAKTPTGSPGGNVGQQLAIEALGQWGSSIQRGCEAALLRYAMVERRAQTGNPMVLMGDFNDILSDGVLSALTSVDTRIKPDPLQGEVEHQLRDHRLNDAYELYQSSQYSLSCQQRPATHYYFAKGSVLDYILLSSEFDIKNSRSLAEVGRYETYDRHLINPRFERDSQSTDHAVVMITISIRH